MDKEPVVTKVRPGIRALSPYVVKELDYEVIQADKNENPYDVPEKVKQEIIDRVMDRKWSRYPPIVARDLYRDIAAYAGWKADGIVVGNGSDELIMTVLSTFLEPGKSIVLPTPTFPMFRYMAALIGAEVIEVPLNPDYSYDTGRIEETFPEQGDMLAVCSPNNPTGAMYPRESLERILEATDKPVIADEAYFEFSRETVIDLCEKYDNLIILRTFSKAFSLAGLRIGYALMDPALATEIGKVKLPFNLDVFSIAAAQVILKNPGSVLDSLETLSRERDRVFARMQAMENVTPYPSSTNFILFKTPLDPALLFDEILRGGVLVRNLSANPALANTLRFTVSMPEDNDTFLAALERGVATLS